MYFTRGWAAILLLLSLGFHTTLALPEPQVTPPKGPSFCKKQDPDPGTKKRDIIHNQYVVRMASGMARHVFDNTMNQIRSALGADDQLRHTFFFSDFRGFSIEASPLVMDIIRALPGIEDIAENEILHDQLHQVIQHDTTYGLDRISHRTNGFFAGRNYSFSYFDPPAGAGATVYVIDTGIYADHSDFRGRVRKGADYSPRSPNGNNAFTDYIGHGTHVASIAAGYHYGVAKKAEIVDVKIFNDAGHTNFEAEVAAISWAANDAEDTHRQKDSVINMSFGGVAGSGTNIINYAVRSAIRAGLLCVISAGNDAENVDGYSPAGETRACTVGGTAYNDKMYVCSNFGDGIDIWAPGEDVIAAGIANPTSVSTKSGTSMAAPYVAGVATYLKSFKTSFHQLNPENACQHMIDFASKGYINFPDYAVPSGKNLIVFSS